MLKKENVERLSAMKQNNISVDEMWQAVITNDKSYDGQFFYAVKTTGIYCRPSCKSKMPKRENVHFYNTSNEAMEGGYRPCKRCRSDLMDYTPIKEIAEDIKDKINKYYIKKDELDNQIENIGLSNHRINEIFKQEYGITVLEYVNKLKLEEAKRLLSETDESIIDVANSIGFSSLSGFYRFFKEEVNTTPAKYRKMYRESSS